MLVLVFLDKFITLTKDFTLHDLKHPITLNKKIEETRASLQPQEIQEESIPEVQEAAKELKIPETPDPSSNTTTIDELDTPPVPSTETPEENASEETVIESKPGIKVSAVKRTPTAQEPPRKHVTATRIDKGAPSETSATTRVPVVVRTGTPKKRNIPTSNTATKPATPSTKTSQSDVAPQNNTQNANHNTPSNNSDTSPANISDTLTHMSKEEREIAQKVKDIARIYRDAPLP